MSDPADLTYKELCKEYDPIIDEPIVLAQPENPTIFDISGYPHYEEVISNWYAFFFDPVAEHSLRDLFLQSLIEVIKKNNDHEEFSLEDCRVEREFQTDKGKFIDLVLYEQAEENEKSESAIIIENKISAGIYNDLNDYYNSVKTEPGQKVGVVISLKKIDVPHQKFLNITHEELLEAIQRNLGDYVVSANPKYIPNLQDFILNLEQMTKPEKMQDSIKYYFDNATKIDEILNLRKEAEEYLRKNLRYAVERDNKYKLRPDAEGAFRFAYTFGPSNYCVMFYLYYIETIRTEKKFSLSVWLYGEEVVEHWKRVDGRNRLRKNEYQLKFKFHENSDGKKWAYLAEQKYKIPDFEKFGETVVQFLKEDWSDFLKDVTDILN